METVHSGDVTDATARAAEAIELARRWVDESAAADVDPAAQKLAGVLKDPNGLPFTIGFVDGVMRPESLVAAASNLRRVAPLVPEFLPWYLRAAVRAGGAVAPALPSPVVPIARRVLREMVGHLIVDARPDKLGPALAALRQPQGPGLNGARLNLNLLGEAVLGEREALRRLEGIHDLIRRDDVDYVSVKVSAIVSHISMWAFDEVVDTVVERLLPLYLTASATGTFINLDMEEYRDLDLTIAVFTRILEDPRLQRLEAGIVLQAYLPDALPALQQLTAWAQQRVAAGGARIKVRLVKGANLAMERVDAVMHDWPLATHASKLDSDASYLRCLDVALQPEHTAAVRIGVAGHNLFDVAYAWTLAGHRGVRDRVDFEMLLGMAEAQAEAVCRTVGGLLLYVPVVHPKDFDVAIAYLVRRLEEGASQENFMSAVFELHSDDTLYRRERDRFVASLAALDAVSDDGGVPQPNRCQDRRTDDPAGSERPVFANVADTDPSLPGNLAWGRAITERIANSDVGLALVDEHTVTDADHLERVIAGGAAAGREWSAQSGAQRAAILRRAAGSLEAARAQLLEMGRQVHRQQVREAAAVQVQRPRRVGHQCHRRLEHRRGRSPCRAARRRSPASCSAIRSWPPPTAVS